MKLKSPLSSWLIVQMTWLGSSMGLQFSLSFPIPLQNTLFLGHVWGRTAILTSWLWSFIWLWFLCLTWTGSNKVVFYNQDFDSMRMLVQYWCFHVQIFVAKILYASSSLLECHSSGGSTTSANLNYKADKVYGLGQSSVMDSRPYSKLPWKAGFNRFCGSAVCFCTSGPAWIRKKWKTRNIHCQPEITRILKYQLTQ